jgi:hypothetical protein
MLFLRDIEFDSERSHAVIKVCSIKYVLRLIRIKYKEQGEYLTL